MFVDRQRRLRCRIRAGLQTGSEPRNCRVCWPTEIRIAFANLAIFNGRQGYVLFPLVSGILPALYLTVRLGLTIVGSSVGTDEEMQELLEMAVKGDVVPQVEVFDFSQINNVMERLAKSEIGGRVVLKLPE